MHSWRPTGAHKMKIWWLLSICVGVSAATPKLSRNVISSGEINVNGRIIPNAQFTDTVVLNVLDYGAIPNNASFDNSDAFQKALNASLDIGGAAVFVPSGHYYFDYQLTVPMGVALYGSYRTAPIHSFPPNISSITDGSVLAPRYGQGSNDTAKSFISMQDQSSMQGLVIFYPEQPCINQAPQIYPPTIYVSKPDVTVTDVELLNSWIGVYADTSPARHFLARITGQPVHIGIYIDECYDIGRVENIQFKANYCHEPRYWQQQQFYGTSFVLGRTDWQYMFNTFSWGYAVGYHFKQTAAGKPTGNFLGIGADACNNYSVLIDSVKPWGVVITNGEFVAMRNTQLNSTSVPVVVQINENDAGSVQFDNCMFWGSAQYIAQITGNAQVSMNNCQMQAWDAIYQNNSAAIQVSDGTVKLVANNFFLDKPQAYFRAGTRKAIAIGNTVEGSVDFKVDDGIQTSIANNL